MSVHEEEQGGAAAPGEIGERSCLSEERGREVLQLSKEHGYANCQE